MFRRMLLGALLVCALGGPARAAPFWVAWEGNDYPENEGWERNHQDPNQPATRSLADGIMTLDGLASIEITDFYEMSRSLNPDPGEEFVVQWGLRVNEVGNPNFPYDPGFLIANDDGWLLVLVFGVNGVFSILEQEDVGFEPGVFHAWELRSFDMRSYSLLVDGALIRTGTFTETISDTPRISWGDSVFGSNSNSDWDYFRFGVVPEPASCISLLVLLCAGRASNRTRRLS